MIRGGLAQVAPLLPGGGQCVVLVTSRRHLGDLPGAVVPVLLDVLPAGRAEEMFTRLAPRAAADLAGVAEVVRLAGFLPLGVSLLARVFAAAAVTTCTDHRASATCCTEESAGSDKRQIQLARGCSRKMARMRDKATLSVFRG